jgi:hypothetical protein
MASDDKAGEFIVIALTSGSKPGNAKGCSIIPKGNVFQATHSQMFGPASRSDCEKWVQKNCFAGVLGTADSTSTASTHGANMTTTIVGTLTAEGIECQAMRADQTNELYTLTGKLLDGFKTGDHVKVTGNIAQVSICQQGITINVSAIDRVAGGGGIAK